MNRPLLLAFLLCVATLARADVVAPLLKSYEAAGASKFSAKDAEAAWVQPHLDAKTGESRKCSSCHTEDLRRVGKHATTGKAIDPLAPSANPKRLTDAEHVEKWFTRNCKWTYGRDCSAQEKGNFLLFIQSK